MLLSFGRSVVDPLCVEWGKGKLEGGEDIFGAKGGELDQVAHLPAGV